MMIRLWSEGLFSSLSLPSSFSPSKNVWTNNSLISWHLLWWCTFLLPIVLLMWVHSLQWPRGVCMSVMCYHMRPSHSCWLVGVIAALCHRVLLWFIPARLFETELESQKWLVDQPSGYSPFVLNGPGGLTARRKAVRETSLLWKP